MIACSKCGQVIIDESCRDEGDGKYSHAICPTDIITKSELEPFGKRAVVGRDAIRLSDLQMGCIQLTACALYNLNREITAEAVHKMWPDDDEVFTGVQPTVYHINKYLMTKAFITDMAKRGVRLDHMAQQLTTEQFALIEMFRNPSGRSFDTMLKRAKVPKSKFNSWMKQPMFLEHFQKMVGDNTDQALMLSEITVADRASNGDLNATKFLWEFRDKFVANNKNATSGNELVGIILDAVQQVIGPLEKGDVHLQEIKQLIQFKATGLGL